MERDEEVKKNVSDVLENAHNYATQLQDLLSNLKDAQIQIQGNASQARSSIEETFSCLKSMMTAAMDHRKEELIAQVCSIQEDELLPLQECYDVINEKLNLTLELVDEGQKILHERRISDDTIVKFNGKSATLGSLPEVPHPSQVPCISFNFDPMLPSQFATTLSSHGTVSQTSPVQITKSFDRPGALLLCWEEVETEKEAFEFRLQYSKGDARKMEHIFFKFVDVYSGPETSFLVKDLVPDMLYSFRVCSRVDRSNCWSAWSIPYVTGTSLSPFEWDRSNENYLLSDNSSTATKSTKVPSVLFSAGPQFGSGHSLTFTIEDKATRKDDEGVGLARRHVQDAKTLLHPGFIFVNMDGYVYIDGNEMTTRLPALEKGSSVAFESEALPNGKLRIAIECGEKTVCYDWKMDQKDGHKLAFVAFFRREGWKVSVD